MSDPPPYKKYQAVIESPDGFKEKGRITIDPQRNKLVIWIHSGPNEEYTTTATIRSPDYDEIVQRLIRMARGIGRTTNDP